MRTLVRLVGFVAALAALTAQAAPIGDPFYVWVFGEWSEDPLDIGIQTFTEAVVRSRNGGEAGESYAFGPSVRGQMALGTVYAGNGAEHFWAAAESPSRGGALRNVFGGSSEIEIYQSYTKDVASASLRFVYSGGRLEVFDFGNARPDRYYPTATVSFDVEVLAGDDYPSPAVSVWREIQTAQLDQDVRQENVPLDDQFRLFVESETGNLPPWVWTCDVCGQSAVGIARAELDAPYAGEIDLSQVDVGAEFTVRYRLTAVAFDDAQGETNAQAIARDPAGGDTGVSFELSGLTPTNRPVVQEPGTTTTTLPTVPSTSTTVPDTTTTTSSTTTTTSTTSTTLPCDGVGIAGVVCLLAVPLPESCADEVPATFLARLDEARAAAEGALTTDKPKRLRRLLRAVLKKLDRADKILGKAESRGELSAACAEAARALVSDVRAAVPPDA